jgi:hypothetical protein
MRCLSGDLCGNPLRERDRLGEMAAGRSVHLMHLSEVFAAKPSRSANHCWPKAAVNLGDLALDEAADQDLFGIADGPGEFEDLVAAWVRPPAAADGIASDGVGERGHRATNGFEYHAVLAKRTQELYDTALAALGEAMTGKEMIHD